MKKNRSRIIQTLIFIVCMLTSTMAVFSQHSKTKVEDSLKAITVNRIMAEKIFLFKPQSVSPMKGGTRQLTTTYFLIVNKDSLASDLPYFGQAYQAPMNSSEAGIKLSTKQFDYLSKPRKKGGWEITITPRSSFVSKFQLTIFENGSTSLNVNFNDRQPISFQGNLEEVKN